ncbi:MAG: hypothetical protein A2075_13380 [Geobacteraceae bacterium GWC2_58_44]|nr:MAG: hypothetical protein A2075_13380 [Geobacteraceae bacterium GWC2_58_44]HBG05499.1 hypothetical protein [Geobacter sp.]
MQRRMIKRDFRQIRSPVKFFAFCKKVQHGLTDTPGLPDSIAALRQQFLEKVDRLDTTYHLALDGGRSVIREREKLSEEIVVLLDQIASVLEAAFILNPDALLTTGFTVTQERRSANRVKLPLVAPHDFKVANAGERGRALATASTFAGALLHEIHINQKDPSVEDDWFHKAIFPDSQNMIMDNLAAGNTYFRMRHQGQEGPGPWSGVVSTTIT